MEYKILFVDDDLDILEMLCSIFRRAGYTDLVTASSGPEALRGWREPVSYTHLTLPTNRLV